MDQQQSLSVHNEEEMEDPIPVTMETKAALIEHCEEFTLTNPIVEEQNIGMSREIVLLFIF